MKVSRVSIFQCDPKDIAFFISYQESFDWKVQFPSQDKQFQCYLERIYKISDQEKNLSFVICEKNNPTNILTFQGCMQIDEYLKVKSPSHGSPKWEAFYNIENQLLNNILKQYPELTPNKTLYNFSEYKIKKNQIINSKSDGLIDLLTQAKENQYDAIIKILNKSDETASFLQKSGLPLLTSYNLKLIESNNEYPFTNEQNPQIQFFLFDLKNNSQDLLQLFQKRELKAK